MAFQRDSRDSRDETVPDDPHAGTADETPLAPETNPSAESWFTEIGRWRADRSK